VKTGAGIRSRDRQYSEMMRGVVVAVLALAMAVAGGVIALLLGDATGLGADVTTVVVPAPADTQALPAASTTLPRLGNGFDPAAIYASRAPGVVTLYADLGASGQSQGSGFVVDDRGTILTNAHVVTNVATSSDVRGARRVFVEFRDRDRVAATIVGWDLFSDVAVVRVEKGAHGLSPVPLGDSSGVRVGEPVAAIGSPFNEQSSLSVGVVSAIGRSIDSLTSRYRVADAIQVDAPINRGNSGGPLFDAGGRVIGINAQIRSDSGTAEGVGFAIPINVARRALEQLVRDGRVAYAYIGITTQDVTPGLAARLGVAADRGALVVRVEPGSPAARAGLQAGSESTTWNGLEVTAGGDVVVAIGGTPVRGAADVSRLVAEELLPGQTVPFTVLRDGTKRRTVRVTLVDRPPPTG
jgi:S1-C subfamily serine protease